jgi:hypothetical protein
MPDKKVEHVEGQTNLAWLAGFFEGEGTIFIRQRTQRASAFPGVGVVQVDRAMLEPYLAFGGSIRKQGPASDRDRIAYRWGCEGHKAIAFLDAIEPFVRSPRNRARIAAARRLQEMRGATQGRHTDAAQKAKQDELFEQMKVLNQRGAVAEQMDIYDVLADMGVDPDLPEFDNAAPLDEEDQTLTVRAAVARRLKGDG